MAKFKPIEILKTLSGKVCMHSDTYFANKSSAKVRFFSHFFFWWNEKKTVLLQRISEECAAVVR